jgi:hypothetical protein
MAASIHSREKFRCADGFEMTAHVFRPQTPNRVPGTLFIYEAFGMNGEMIRVAGEHRGCTEREEFMMKGARFPRTRVHRGRSLPHQREQIAAISDRNLSYWLWAILSRGMSKTRGKR